MSKPSVSLTQLFVARFAAVKQATGGDPAKLEAFYEQHAEITKAADELDWVISIGDLERRLARHPKKYLERLPETFLDEFEEFKRRWKGPLQEIKFRLPPDLIEANNRIVEAFAKLERPDADQRVAQGADTTSSAEDLLEPPDLDFDREFDPLIHDPDASLDLVFWAARNDEGMFDTESEDRVHVASKIGLETWDYLQNTIGLNTTDVFRRWRMVPMMYLPTHVSNAYGATETGSLHQLIDDAVRAFVFGAPTAAIAACRAALEMVLKKHYGLDYQYKDQKGRLRDEQLGALIVMADARYTWFQGPRIEKLVKRANGVMHDYATHKRLTEEDERSIVQFLKTIKYLIERAPD